MTTIQNGALRPNSAAITTHTQIQIPQLSLTTMRKKWQKTPDQLTYPKAQFYDRQNKLRRSASTLASSWRDSILRQKPILLQIYGKACKSLLKGDTVYQISKNTLGHKLWSQPKLFIDHKNQIQGIRDNMTKVVKKKLSTSGKGGTGSVKEDRVEKYLKEAKAKSKARVEARLKKKVKDRIEKERLRNEKYEEDERKALEELKRKSDEEFKESEEICQYLDKERQATKVSQDDPMETASKKSDEGSTSKDVEMTSTEEQETIENPDEEEENEDDGEETGDDDDEEGEKAEKVHDPEPGNSNGRASADLLSYI